MKFPSIAITAQVERKSTQLDVWYFYFIHTQLKKGEKRWHSQRRTEMSFMMITPQREQLKLRLFCVISVIMRYSQMFKLPTLRFISCFVHRFFLRFFPPCVVIIASLSFSTSLTQRKRTWMNGNLLIRTPYQCHLCWCFCLYKGLRLTATNNSSWWRFSRSVNQKLSINFPKLAFFFLWRRFDFLFSF